MEENVIEAENLWAGYGANQVLKGLSLRVPQGSLCALAGPNGAGKSTFIKLCLGQLKAKQGRLLVMGKNPSRRGAFRRVLWDIGYVPQRSEGSPIPTTVREAVAMGCYGRAGIFRPLSRDAWKRVDQALEAAGIAPLADKLVRELSGGQVQRTAFARALAMDAGLLLLDEPASNLDQEGRNDMLRILRTERQYRHITIVLVSHDSEALDFCDRVYHFDKGNCQLTYRMQSEEVGPAPSWGPPFLRNGPSHSGAPTSSLCQPFVHFAFNTCQEDIKA
jgi:ABC-type Mn2+/Zn2+ transport system ATPase subunit